MNKTNYVQRGLLFIMKVTLIHIFFSSFSVLMANSLDSNGQNVLEKKLSLDIDNTRVEDALEIISTKAGVTFTYSPDLFETSRLVSLHMSNARLSDVLAKLFDSDIDYEVKDTRISLNPGDLPIPISGKIRDENGEPLPGANVLVKGTTSGTITNEKGEFQLEATPDAILQISSIGYKTIEMPIGNQTSIDVKMEIDVTQLTEVVVVGYGTQNKATLAGSIAQVDGAEIMKSPAPNITSSLQGRLPGLSAVQRSGQPGKDDATLLIRGAQTLGDSGPLIVIDGVQGRGNIGRLNPEDIETITVLKDASAAIYGARGANGVLIVTTKNGVKGKPNFSFTYKQGASSPTQIPDVLDAPTFATVYNEGGYYRAGRNPNYYNNPQYSAAAIQAMADGSDPVLYPNTDMVGLMLKPSPSSRQITTNLSVSGGVDNIRYLMSFGSVDQNSPFVADATHYRQYNTRLKLDIDLVKNVTVGINTSAIFNQKNYSNGGGIAFVDVLGANPTLTAKYPNGLLGPGRLNQNPLLNDQRGYQRIDETPFYNSLTASFKIPYVDGLKLDGSFNFDVVNEHDKRWSTPYYYYEYNTITSNYDYKQGTNTPTANLTDSYSRSTNKMYNLRLSYDQIFAENHHVFGMFGFEQQQINRSEASAIRRNFLSPGIDEINVGGTNPADYGSTGTSSNDAYDNLLGRFNYDFKSKYIAEFLFRRDGSPRFPDGSRYGFFPGGSVAWRLSEEDFFKNAVPFVDQLKIRASYGELGNDRIAAFQYLQFFGFGGNYVFGNTIAPGLSTQTLPNKSVTWERAKKTDIGIVTSMWNGKLGMDLTLWKQNRSDILVARNLGIPSTMGFTGLPPENYGEVDSRGYELALSHRNKAGQLNYSISGNVAYAVSKVIQMDEVPPAQDRQRATGMPLGTQLYYKSDGIFNTAEERNEYPRHNNQQVGDIKVLDLNEDGLITNADTYRNPYTSTPRYIFGLNSDFQYKNFDLTIFFQGQTGVRNYDGTAQALGGTDFTNAAVWRAEDRWTEQNPNGTKPRSDPYQLGNTDFFLFDATFVRLKTVEFGYSIPTDLLAKTKFIKNFRVFFSGFNVATWAKEIKWADPEINGGYFTWPPQRVMTIGGTIKF